MLNNQKENKEILGKEETGVDFVKETNADETSAASATVQSAQISGLNHVENAVVNKKGCCLQACIAMWVNRAIGRNLTALDVYNDMDEVANSVEGATVDNLNAAYMLQEYYHCGPCKSYPTALSPNQVLQQLQTGKPVIMYIRNSANTERHAVIVKGIQINGSFITYTVDDPNKKHDPKELTERTITQYVGKADTASDKISTHTTYSTATGSTTYNTWYKTISNTI